MLGQTRRHSGLEAVNVVRVFGVPIASFGQQSAARQQCWQDGRGAVRKILLQDGKVAGGQLVGEINGTGVLHEMMKKGVEAERFGESLAHPSYNFV